MIKDDQNKLDQLVKKYQEVQVERMNSYGIMEGSICSIRIVEGRKLVS